MFYTAANVAHENDKSYHYYQVLLLFIYFETGSFFVALAVLELTDLPSCFHFQSTVITGKCHCAWLTGFCSSWD